MEHRGEPGRGGSIRPPRARRSAEHRGGAGEPLLLIHGFTDTWTTWTPLLPRLEAYHDVVAPTLPGHLGGPAVPPGTPIGDALFADFLEQRLDELGWERAHLAGNSLGGWLSLELAARGRALSVSAICPAGGWYPDTRAARTVARYFQRNGVAMRTGDWWIDPFSSRPRLRRLLARDVLAPSTRLTATQARQMFEGAQGCTILQGTVASGRNATLFGELGPITCPVRILYGSRDRIVRWPGHFPRLRALVPEAEWVELPGMGHLAMWDNPEFVAREILGLTSATHGAARQSA